MIFFQFAFSNISLHMNENLFFFFLLGSLTSIGGILPGVSGSFILLSVGYYSWIISKIKGLFSFSLGYQESLELLFFILGLLITVILFSKIIYKLFKKFKEKFNAFFSGVVLASLFFLFKEVFYLESGKVDFKASLFLLFLISFSLFFVLDIIVRKRKKAKK